MDVPTGIEVPSRKTWRAWLRKNHAKSTSVWLVYYKKESGHPSVSYTDAVEEALCHGWIDSTVRPIDNLRWMQLFTPRRPKSVWSKLNKSRVEKLTADGLMTPAGQTVINAAKANGSWTAIDASENGIMPPDLKKALTENPAAKKHFAAFPPSTQKYSFQWIYAAKRAETRNRRVAEIVARATLNRRPRENSPPPKPRRK